MAFRSSNVSSDRAPPRGSFAPEHMPRRSRPRDHGRPAIRSESPRYRVLRGRNRRQMRVPRESNVAEASARRRAEISRQAVKLQSPLRRELALGRCPWRSFGRRTGKRRVRQWRREPLMPRLAPEPCSRRQSRRNDRKESQAQSQRRSAAAFRLRPQAHRRLRARSWGERRSTPRPTCFVGQDAALAAHSMTLGSAHGQQTGRVDCAPSYSQSVPDEGGLQQIW